MQTSLFTPEEYRAKLEELELLRDQVQLDADPVACGLTEINRKLSYLQAARERVSALLSEAIANKNLAQQMADRTKYAYEAAVSRLLVTDGTIKAMRSSDLRRAAADVKLAVELDGVHLCEMDLSQADTYFKRVANVHKDLETKNANLIQQINVVRMQLNIDPSLRDELRQQQ